MQAAGTAASGDPVYVEDVFSTHLYTGDAESFNTIINGIDLAGEGGLVWIKERSSGGGSHKLLSTDASGNHSGLLDSSSSSAAGTGYQPNYFFQNNNGFKTTSVVGDTTVQGNEYASWTFRIQEGFFDVVTYTGNSTSGHNISHSLGSVPKMMIIKSTSHSGIWWVYHESLGATKFLRLNLTHAEEAYTGAFNDTAPTSSVFTVGNDSEINYTGRTYVAYLFGDEATFGDDGDEAILKTGSFTGTSSGETAVNLGFEPQFIIYKMYDASGDNWRMHDNMRGWNVNDRELLNPNDSASESSLSNTGGFEIKPTSTGFIHEGHVDGSNNDWIYMAIRRGPMKEPDAGTDVYNAVTFTGTGSAADIDSGFPVDLAIPQKRTANQYYNFRDRLRGNKQTLQLPLTSAQFSNASLTCEFDDMNGFHHAGTNIDSGYAANGQSSIAYMFRRYRSVFDMAFYSGTGSNLDVTHNLNVVPEMQIIKRLDSGTNADWVVYHKDVPATGSYNGQYFFLNDGSIGYAGSTTVFLDTPTASVFKVGTNDMVNNSSGSYIWYGFASLSGISHVGSYTGTGNDINVTDLGAAARFVFIKRADEWVGGAGGYYVFDTARGIVAGNDVYSLWNSTSAEVTNTDYIDPHSSGFTITSSAPDSLNANGGKYFYLAFA